MVQSEYFFIDSEEETSDAEVEGEIFTEEADEPEEDDPSVNDEDGEQSEAENPKEPKENKVKVPKDNRNYIANPKESFVLVDLSVHPQKIEPPVFNSNGSGRNSILMFRDKSPSEIADHLLDPLIRHVVKMYNVNRAPDVKELTVAKFRAWLGIHFMTHAWRLPVLKRYWSSGTFATVSVPDFSTFMPYTDFIEIRRNLRFEDYRKENELKPTDKAWKVRSLLNIVRDMFKEINPAPGQMLSLDEAMAKYTGNKCPVVVGAPSKPIKRGIKFYVLVDYETGVVVDIKLHDGSVTKAMGENHPGGVVGKHVVDLCETLPGTGYILFIDNFYTSVGIARHLLNHRLMMRLVGTLRNNKMTDFGHLIKLGAAKKQKASKSKPRGLFKMCKSEDGLVMGIGLMDTSACYFLDTAYGYNRVDMSRREQGSPNKVSVPVPEGVKIYNDFMGGVDEFDRLRLGDHGFEGRGRAFKWTNRFFDTMVNTLFQAAYKIYKHCRDKKEGNEPPLLHVEFNEIVIEHFLNNAAWKMEKEMLATGKRVSIRKLTESSEVFQNVEINFKEPHDLKCSKEVYAKTTRMKAYSCELCKADRPIPPLTDKNRTRYYCAQCSSLSIKVSDYIYLHPECFGEYHRRKYRAVLGSSNVKGLVIGR